MAQKLNARDQIINFKKKSKLFDMFYTENIERHITTNTNRNK